MEQTTQQTLVIERADGEHVPLVELTPLVSISAVEPGVKYRLSLQGAPEDKYTRIEIEDIPSSTSSFVHTSNIPLPYDGYMTRGLAQLVSLGPTDNLSIPRRHLDGSRYTIFVPYPLEELWMTELKQILNQCHKGSRYLFDLIPSVVLEKLSNGPPTERCSYFPGFYI